MSPQVDRANVDYFDFFEDGDLGALNIEIRHGTPAEESVSGPGVASGTNQYIHIVKCSINADYNVFRILTAQAKQMNLLNLMPNHLFAEIVKEYHSNINGMMQLYLPATVTNFKIY